MTIIREASAVWDGNIRDGAGYIDLGAEAQGYFNKETRFTNDKHHNPESLAAGAQAGSYAMALADGLAGAGHTPVEIRVTVRLILEQRDDGTPFIPTVAINARAQVNNIDHDSFVEIANKARATCPVANLFAGAEIALDADTIGG